jgi:hypothetical protein
VDAGGSLLVASSAVNFEKKTNTCVRAWCVRARACVGVGERTVRAVPVSLSNGSFCGVACI